MVFAKEGMGYLFFFFFIFFYSSFSFLFSNTFVLHSHIPLFCNQEILRKTLEELRAIIPHKILFIFSPTVEVKHFVDGKACLCAFLAQEWQK